MISNAHIGPLPVSSTVAPGRAEKNVASRAQVCFIGNAADPGGRTARSRSSPAAAFPAGQQPAEGRDAAGPLGVGQADLPQPVRGRCPWPGGMKMPDVARSILRVSWPPIVDTWVARGHRVLEHHRDARRTGSGQPHLRREPAAHCGEGQRARGDLDLRAGQEPGQRQPEDPLPEPYSPTRATRSCGQIADGRAGDGHAPCRIRRRGR